jgi:4-carboxymuconolactone decarboxylase
MRPAEISNGARRRRGIEFPPAAGIIIHLHRQAGRRNGMDHDYEKGYKQFAAMVGEENIELLVSRFRAVCPDFEKEVIAVLGGRIWSRGGIDLKTRSLCSICVLAALGRSNALKLNFQMALRNGARLEEIFEAIFQVAAYAGFAAAWDALEKLAEVLDG